MVEWRRLNYLESVGEINKHNPARTIFATSTVQANCSNHIDSTALDKIGVSSEFEYLKTFSDGCV